VLHDSAKTNKAEYPVHHIIVQHDVWRTPMLLSELLRAIVYTMRQATKSWLLTAT